MAEVHQRWLSAKRFTASLFTHAKEKASEASAKHAGVGFASEASTHPLPSQVLRFGLASSSLAILPASTIKQEDLLDLITALLKFNCFLSTTVATQCIFQSNL